VQPTVVTFFRRRGLNVFHEHALKKALLGVYEVTVRPYRLVYM
jgi:hypothetical protein